MKKKGSRDSAGDRFARLAALGESVFHASDLANLWNIRKPQTLHTTLSRYVASGLLHRIHKGLYTLHQSTDLDPHLLGVKALHALAYVSCESVLFDHGIINQPPQEMTLVSGVSKRFTIAHHRFRSRKLRDNFLMNDAGITTHNGVRIASLPRAIADMLYFYPKKYFDAPNRIRWSEVRAIVDAVGYTLEI